jgi:hypothetical protein
MKSSLLILLFFLATSVTLAQREIDESGNPPFKKRVYGGVGLGFAGGTNTYGNKYFYFGLYPTMGYMINNQLSTGVTITWQHYNYPDYDQTYDQFGLSPFLRYNFQQFFLYSEFMVLNSPAFNLTERQNYSRFMLGAGFSQPLGKRTAINVVGMYDVLFDPVNRAFASPWLFRVFLTF